MSHRIRNEWHSLKSSKYKIKSLALSRLSGSHFAAVLEKSTIMSNDWITATATSFRVLKRVKVLWSHWTNSSANGVCQQLDNWYFCYNKFIEPSASDIFVRNQYSNCRVTFIDVHASQSKYFTFPEINQFQTTHAKLFKQHVGLPLTNCPLEHF